VNQNRRPLSEIAQSFLKVWAHAVGEELLDAIPCLAQSFLLY
jgi:hypothetical protein